MRLVFRIHAGRKGSQAAHIKTQRFAGIRLDHDRILRLLEILMAGQAHISGLSAATLRAALLQAYELKDEAYSKNQLSYDLRKLRAHGLIERLEGRFAYRLTLKGRKAAALMVLLRNRILRPLSGSLFERSVKETYKPSSKLQAQYRIVKKSLNELIRLMKVA